METIPSPEKFISSYEQAKQRVAEIADYLNYRYDMPKHRLNPDDEDFDRYVCRNTILSRINMAIHFFLENVEGMSSTDDMKILEIKKLQQRLVDIGQATWTRDKTPEEMDEIKQSVKQLVVLSQEYLNDIQKYKFSAV